MEALVAQREATQPIEVQDRRLDLQESARPQGLAADRRSRLPGPDAAARAQVSEKHCNFLINTGDATAADIEALGEEVRARVKEKSGVALEWEIKRVGVRMTAFKQDRRADGRPLRRARSLAVVRPRRGRRRCARKASTPSSSIPATIPAQQLFEAKPDAVFNALHGRFGEDGTVQGLLELMRIPYTHSGVLSSALAMHKERTKDVYRAAGLPVVKSIVADRREAASAHLMEPPYVVKPVNEGSSRRRLHHPQGRQPPAGRTGQRQLESLQRDDGGGIRARPRTDRLGDGRHARWASPRSPPTWNSTITKPNMRAGGSQHMSAGADSRRRSPRKRWSWRYGAHEALGCRGVTRTDFRYDDTGAKHRLILLETNTQPGMTPTSLVPEQAAHVGMCYAKLCRWMVEDASCDR